MLFVEHESSTIAKNVIIEMCFFGLKKFALIYISTARLSSLTPQFILKRTLPVPENNWHVGMFGSQLPVCSENSLSGVRGCTFCLFLHCEASS